MPDTISLSTFIEVNKSRCVLHPIVNEENKPYYGKITFNLEAGKITYIEKRETVK